MVLLKIQQAYAEDEDTDNVEELFDKIIKEAEYGDKAGNIDLETEPSYANRPNNADFGWNFGIGI